MAAQIIFWVFSVLAVVSAVACVSLNDPVESVLSLVLTFFSMAGLWLMLQAEFLSLILLLVYVGAVMTLFLFVVMMISSHLPKEKRTTVRYLPAGILILILFFTLLITWINQHFSSISVSNAPAVTGNNIAQLGLSLFVDYVYSFEIAGLILLAAIVAAICLTHENSVLRRKSQSIDEQVKTTREQAVRLVHFPKKEEKR